MKVRVAAFAAAVLSFSAQAQTPAIPAPVPPDVSPLYVVTYIEVRPSANDEGAALLKNYLYEILE